MSTTTSERPLRADARRNRERVLAGARDAFGDVGLDAQMDEIARRAGVGVGTVYRHFPTKEALVQALAEAHFDQLADVVEAAAAQPGEDPWEDFAGAIWCAASPTADDVSLCEMLAGVPTVLNRAASGQLRLMRATETLIARAQAAGTMRADATAQDIATIMCGFGHVAAAQRAGARLDWRRYLEIALDGLRAR